MKFSKIATIAYAIFFLVIVSSSTAFADVSTYKCNQGPACIDERVNFGTAQIKCTDVNGDVLSDWVCEYELEYTCTNQLTGEIRKGGFDPMASSLCSKLCGPCKEGWK
ncbi:hypothetical protein [Maridesulfovibrio salexigens]|uniref:CVNH domain-containing protein n=1 Tax=Maridesulfovibrio salexigens (strain ATCC 14822 / DSM 2638 / NCIMB 8403 / VKM B-1763) TaxID=526222 RepID=C6BUD2_MARSD|nr:hypothetical protein [Maridesulfovibrio salexigens]ACS79941.1 hypothetical protein Desal_1880 [Maridesulfovibrio salexigens DSM 2638]